MAASADMMEVGEASTKRETESKVIDLTFYARLMDQGKFVLCVSCGTTPEKYRQRCVVLGEEPHSFILCGQYTMAYCPDCVRTSTNWMYHTQTCASCRKWKDARPSSPSTPFSEEIPGNSSANDDMDVTPEPNPTPPPGVGFLEKLDTLKEMYGKPIWGEQAVFYKPRPAGTNPWEYN